MKFKTGEIVIVLNTEHKPAGTAIVKNYQALSGKYKVLFQYPLANEAEEIDIPEERLVAPEVFLEHPFGEATPEVKSQIQHSK